MYYVICLLGVNYASQAINEFEFESCLSIKKTNYVARLYLLS